MVLVCYFDIIWVLGAAEKTVLCQASLAIKKKKRAEKTKQRGKHDSWPEIWNSGSGDWNFLHDEKSLNLYSLFLFLWFSLNLLFFKIILFFYFISYFIHLFSVSKNSLLTKSATFNPFTIQGKLKVSLPSRLGLLNTLTAPLQRGKTPQQVSCIWH